MSSNTMKRPITVSGIPQPMLSSTFTDATQALAALAGSSDASIGARANLTLAYASTSSAGQESFDMLYLSLNDGESLVTLCADVAVEARIRNVSAVASFGDSVMTSFGSLMAYYMREDENTEIQGFGNLVVVSGGTQAQISPQNVASGDIIVFGNGVYRCAQSIISNASSAVVSVGLDRTVSTGSYTSWSYLRRAGVSARTQMRSGEGTMAVTGNVAVFTPSEIGRPHSMWAGDTLIVGLCSRTVQAISGSVFTLDSPMPGVIAATQYAWLPVDGERVVHLFIRQPTIPTNNALRLGSTNMYGSMGSYGALGSAFGTYTGKMSARYLDFKDVMHVKVRSGYRQILSGYPVPGKDTVLTATPPMVCVQSLNPSTSQLYQGFSIRIEPPQSALYRFMNT